MPDLCGVDDCMRRAVVSIDREDFPKPIRMCATHTEDFRMNGSHWTVKWDAATPVSVQGAPVRAPGRETSEVPDPTGPSDGDRKDRVWSRLAAWRPAVRRPGP